MNQSKTLFTALITTIFLATAISGCQKAENENWAADVIGAYHGQDNENQNVSVTVNRNSDKSVTIAYIRSGTISYPGIQFTASNAVLSDSRHCSFSTEHSCSIIHIQGNDVNGCEWYQGTASFSNNSVSISFIDSLTYDGYPVSGYTRSAVASK